MRRGILLLAAMGLAVGGIGVGLTGAGRGDDKSQRPVKPPYVHAVFFTLKKDAPAGAAEALIRDAHEMLGPIPSVRELRAGRPAEKDSQNFVQKGYDVGLLVLFDDYAGLETYLKHSQHQKYVEKHLGSLDPEKILVYDFVNQKP